MVLSNVLFPYLFISVNVLCVRCLDCSSSTKNPLNKRKQSGKQTMLQYATELELSDLCQRITDAIDLRIHSYCRMLLRNEIQKRKNSSEHNELPKKSLRLSLEQSFDWKQNCFCCGQLCLIDERHPERNDSHLVETLHFRKKLLSVCTGNEADNERSEVFNRLINCIDLVQIKARYHDKCRIRFFSTSLSAAVSAKKGRPVNDTRMYYFEKV